MLTDLLSFPNIAADAQPTSTTQNSPQFQTKALSEAAVVFSPAVSNDEIPVTMRLWRTAFAHALRARESTNRSASVKLCALFFKALTLKCDCFEPTAFSIRNTLRE